ncbi:MAG: hypothetical protein FWD22_03840 [Treponema sp.]|nr:hypothetical protein [Treponema sp.]
MNRIISLLCFLLFFPVFITAGDFGLILDNSAGYGGIEKGNIDYKGSVIPHYSLLLGENIDIYLSGSFNIEYSEEEWSYLPELLRTEISFNLNSGIIRAGRIFYSDPLGLIIRGLFDGAGITLFTRAGTFSAGAWYTGLLYKERAKISMTENDLKDDYFAPKRIIGAFDWEHLNLGPLQFNTAVIGQFDLSEVNLNSQYFTGKLTLPFQSASFNLGGCLELIQENDTQTTAFAGVIGMQLFLPTPFKDSLSLIGRFSSGVFEDKDINVFIPITSIYMGNVFTEKLSGLSCLTLDYTFQLNKKLLFSVSSTYFILSDPDFYEGFPITEEKKGNFLGNEFFAKILWNPYSDLQLNLRGGAFLPSLGNAAPDNGTKWRLEFNVIFGL